MIGTSIPDSRFVGRPAGGVLGAMDPTQAAALLTDLVPKSLYGAQTILFANLASTPLALTVDANSIVGRRGSEAIEALSNSRAADVIGTGPRWSGTATVSVANTTAETTLAGAGAGNLTLPGGFFFPIGRTVRFKVSGIWSSDAVAPTLRLRVRLGGIAGTLILDTGAQVVVAAVTNHGWAIEGEITGRTHGATGTVMAQAMARFSSADTVQTHWDLENTAAATINTIVAQELVISAEWGTADADNDIRATNFWVDFIHPSSSF
jgi:hypothetical protein